MNIMYNSFNFSFFQIAIIMGIIIAFASALISPFLVLKRESLISDGLSHAAFLGFAVGITLKQPLYIAVLVCAVAGFLIKFIIKKTSFQSDAVIGIISSLFLAGGLLLISVKSGYNTSLHSLVQGHMFKITQESVVVALVAFSITYLFVLIFYKKLVLITFDYKSAGIPKDQKIFLDYYLTIITSIIVAIGVKLLGAFLITAFMIFPTLFARNFKLNFKKSMVLGVITSIIVTFFSIIIADAIAVPPGPLVIIVYFGLLVISLMYKYFMKRRN